MAETFLKEDIAHKGEHDEDRFDEYANCDRCNGTFLFSDLRKSNILNRHFCDDCWGKEKAEHESSSDTTQGETFN